MFFMLNSLTPATFLQTQLTVLTLCYQISLRSKDLNSSNITA